MLIEHAQVKLAQGPCHDAFRRIVIEQAKGILAERHGKDTAIAFQLLRQHARNNNIKIHDLAAAVVAGISPLSTHGR